MNERDFWYIAARSHELRGNRVIAARILDHWLALFRDEQGRAVALEDRCLHRAAPLSQGRLCAGRLQCAYHGWTYDGEGRVVAVPSEGAHLKPKPAARRFPTCEQDEYVYVRLGETTDDSPQPFRIPFYKAKGWAAIRLRNHFQNTVTNCVENFVDIPHTAFVHPKIFRVRRNERLRATVERKNGSVTVRYQGERANFGIFTKFLNPRGREIEHTDAFHLPNVTCVEYLFGERRRFIITSQAVAVNAEETWVYTDLTYNYGRWNALANPIIRWQAQTIINQDRRILGQQMRTIKQFGAHFSNSEADVIHLMIESIREALARGDDPRSLPDKTHEIEFWV